MKEDLIHLCEDLENNFDQKLVNYDERLERLEKEISDRIENLSGKYPNDDDVVELSQLTIGLRRTRRLLRGKLEAIRHDSDDLVNELNSELKERMPGIRKSIEDSDTYEQAVLEIQRESHTGSKKLGDFFRGLLMWRETPEEHLAKKSSDRL
ncbi:hypothetical protein JIN77_10725 [Verrucomicrobiaceae bacterium R5-34]|uniref:Uncharacterized protein n=1 Tax=Oceaniferula flava TaxID=2800421 RepID=A0AAE2V9M0_9BACT|nr:hypothetical protein [Oceaniferula flavus]MBK1831203.1 hypothetical protein [Verrucomicrobiaceae bacterium R5-34]MBK1855373.1 hypothetical protein [Oceaniferula flavus]MBM1136679.1 hypothetical protein [Oceaniferula flavus]